MQTESIKLTQYSHGAGCGCKISPEVLGTILHSNEAKPFSFDNLVVGNSSRDDAAVLDLGNGTGLISTTDFFMPIVDDPFTFGRIAAANAISDVYAMGGKPVLAIAILGWPVDKIAPEIAQQVVEGGRSMCLEAGIPLAGGHSIDSPEPIFGLAVNGIVDMKNLKQNSSAREGNLLFLTKALGIGILTTAEKKGLLREEDRDLAAQTMVRLNTVGEKISSLEGVRAITDVTGFGLLGHLSEMCEGSDLAAEIFFDAVPRLSDLDYYLEQKSVPGGTGRNFKSYGEKISPMTEEQKNILCDPQTSGGLLVAVEPDATGDFEQILAAHGLSAFAKPIGIMKKRNGAFLVEVK